MNYQEVTQKIRDFSTRPLVMVIAFILVLVWFVAPHIRLGGHHPFASGGARVLLLGLLALAWTSKSIIEQVRSHGGQVIPLFIAKIKLAYQWSKNKWHVFYHYCQTRTRQAKENLQHDKSRRLIRKKPWYLVIGAPQSGKKNLIANMGLYFVKPDHFGSEAINYTQQFPDFDWWFSEQAVLIDSLTYNKDDDIGNWKRFVKLLKRERGDKPLNGIILTISQLDLLLYSNKQRQEFIQEMSYYIRDLHQHFKAQVPVYLSFTKCDLVDGFLEYFNDLNKEEVSQLFGMTFPLDKPCTIDNFRHFFSQEYSDIIKRLRQRVLWILDSERTLRGRQLVHAYPQQMQLFKTPIDHFITELFGAVRYRQALQLRGLYFVSSQQQGEPVDFLFKVMSKKFNLISPPTQRTQRLGECFFLRRLYFDVMAPEASRVGDSERVKQRRAIAFSGFRLAIPTVLVFGTVGMYCGYQDNISQLKQVDSYLDNYQIYSHHISENPSLTAMLPMLNSLRAADTLYQQKSSLSQKLLFATYSIRHRINNSLNRSLNSLFLPRIASDLERQLNKNIRNQDLLYATLKGYLSFSASEYTKPIAIKAPMEFQWNTRYLHQPKTNNQLKYYLDLALAKSLDKLPLDRSLINRRRGELEAINPVDRAYGLLSLRATVADFPNLNLLSSGGGNFSQAFTTPSKNSLIIPALYTARGFNKVFLKQYPSIATEVADDNHDIGLIANNKAVNSSQIERSMKSMYQDKYQKVWQRAIKNTHIKTYYTIDDAIRNLNLLVSHDSPLAHLLNVIYQNSHDINRKYDDVNNFTSSALPKINKRLLAARDYLKSLRKSANYNLAAFNAAKDAIKGKNNPIQNISTLAAKAPEPIRRLLNEIANGCWQAIISGAHHEMNNAWHKEVMRFYDENIGGRYPIDTQSQSQLAIEDFETFYGEKGKLDQYFSKYLKPFINNNQKKWQALKVNGHSIELDSMVISLAQRAKHVQENYFLNGGKKANLHFTIKPRTLDSQATGINIIFGDKHINYSHGPQISTEVIWPLPLNNPTASIYLSSFSGTHRTRAADGPWSLFRILQDGTIHHASAAGTYIYRLNLNGYHASFTITAQSDGGVLGLASLKGFNLPRNIAKETH